MINILKKMINKSKQRKIEDELMIQAYKTLERVLESWHDATLIADNQEFELNFLTSGKIKLVYKHFITYKKRSNNACPEPRLDTFAFVHVEPLIKDEFIARVEFSSFDAMFRKVSNVVELRKFPVSISGIANSEFDGTLGEEEINYFFKVKSEKELVELLDILKDNYAWSNIKS